MRDPTSILDDLRAAAQLGENQTLDGLVLELGANVLVFRVLPSEFFHKMTALLGDEKFRELDNSWKLLYFVDTNWELVSQDQREQLRGILSATFDKFRNFMGAFVIGEVLGRQYADEDALEALLRLSSTAQMPAKALVPHGLETLARCTKDARLRPRAVQRLRELSNSDVEELRKEATISLGKVERG